MAQPTMSSVIRKPARREGVAAARVNPGNILPETRESILDAAVELLASHDPREISSVLARRMGIQESLIDAVLALQAASYRAQFITAKVAIHNAFSMADEARRETWEECA